MLHDTNSFRNDEQALTAISGKYGTTGKEQLDFAMATDGLSSEVEQGITIDVAYKYFSTAKRRFVIVDAPGHEQYTRNMVTGASKADLALLLIDVQNGITAQTKRHFYIAKKLGLKQIVVVINKMDLIDYNQERYDEVCLDFRSLVEELNVDDIQMLPLSGLTGENVARSSGKLNWYQGPSLLDYLEKVEKQNEFCDEEITRFVVQWVNRPNPEFRGYSGIEERMLT